MTKANEKLWCVYMHINKMNGKVYIGVAKGKPEKRWGKNGYGYTRTQPVFARAIEKYKWDGFEHKVVATDLTQREALDMEVALIAEYKSNCTRYKNPSYGYNMTDGGEGSSGFKHTEESKQKLREIRSNTSDETRKRMSESAKERCTEEWRRIQSDRQRGVFNGENNPFYGKHHSEETKALLSEMHKRENMNPETLKKMSENHADVSGEKNPNYGNGRKVVQLTMDGEYIAEYQTIAEATRITGVHNISTCCRGHTEFAGGFKWMYKEDYDKLTQQNDLNEIEPIENLEEDEI